MSENLLFIMTISGSVIVLLYGITYPISKKYFSVRWRYYMLIMAIFFYLIPVSRLKDNILNVIYPIFPGLKTVFSKPLEKIISKVDNSKFIFYSEEAVFIPRKVKLLWFILLIIGIIAVTIIFNQLIQYFKIKSLYLKQDNNISEEWKELLKHFKESKGIKSKVTFMFSRSCFTPMTVGVLSPTIILPYTLFEDKIGEDWKYVLLHELNHIKNRDLLIRFLALLVVGIHWFNPISYILYKEICNISEIYCDFRTVTGFSEDKRKGYSNLIIRLSVQKQTPEKREYYAGLVGGNAKTIERRVLEIKTSGIKKKLLLSCIAGTVFFAAGGITSFAYSPPTVVIGMGDISGNNQIYISSEFDILEEVESLPYDDYYIDINGNVHEITGQKEKIFCQHKEYENVTVKKHIVDNNSNSCDVISYEGQHCLACKYLLIGNEFQNIHYKVCPH